MSALFWVVREFEGSARALAYFLREQEETDLADELLELVATIKELFDA